MATQLDGLNNSNSIIDNVTLISLNLEIKYLISIFFLSDKINFLIEIQNAIQLQRNLISNLIRKKQILF